MSSRALPTSLTGRLLATLVMVVGVGFITVTTGAISSVFIEAARRRREHDGAAASPPGDLAAALEAQTSRIATLTREVASLAEEVRALRGPGERPGL